MHATCPRLSHPHLFNYPNTYVARSTNFGVLIFQFLPFPFTSSLLSPSFIQHPVSKHRLSVFLCLDVGHSYKITCKIILLYILIFDRLCILVIRVPGYRSRGKGSIPGATRFSEKQWVWNRVHSAS
jgi:hypothetical protein